MGTEPGRVEQDSRGILDPGLLRKRVRLTRYPATAALEPVIDRFWAVSWDLPDGVVHHQQVLTHPGANISVGHPSAVPGDRAPGQAATRPAETRPAKTRAPETRPTK